MKDSDLMALIKLLDDEDPEVSEHVWGKLIALGKEEPDRLEAAWEIQDDPVIQRKLEDLLQQVSLKDMFDELLEWRKKGGTNLLEGWQILSKFKYPDNDPQFAQNEINRLVNKVWLALKNTMTPQEKLRVVNHILFTVEGYKNNKVQTHNPDYNYIENVFRRKMGNAVSLGIIYLTVCQKLDLPVHGVIVPGYFILVFLDRDEEFYIDVFNGGLMFRRKDLKRFLKQMGVEEKPSFFKPTSHIYTILHLISYMKRDYTEMGEMEKVQQLDQLLSHIEIKF